MRWKVRLSKNPRRARYTNDATVLGCSRTSSEKRIVPQLVCRVAVQRALRSIFSDGRSSSPSGLGRGAAPLRQPDFVDWALAAPVSVLVVFFLSDEPQPARTTSASR